MTTIETAVTTGPSPAEREAVDVHDDIASACVHAVPYVDSPHLIRTPDGWRILNALWHRADGHGSRG